MSASSFRGLGRAPLGLKQSNRIALAVIFLSILAAAPDIASAGPMGGVGGGSGGPSAGAIAGGGSDAAIAAAVVAGAASRNAGSGGEQRRRTYTRSIQSQNITGSTIDSWTSMVFQ